MRSTLSRGTHSGRKLGSYSLGRRIRKKPAALHKPFNLFVELLQFALHGRKLPERPDEFHVARHDIGGELVAVRALRQVPKACPHLHKLVVHDGEALGKVLHQHVLVADEEDVVPGLRHLLELDEYLLALLLQLVHGAVELGDELPEDGAELGISGIPGNDLAQVREAVRRPLADEVVPYRDEGANQLAGAALHVLDVLVLDAVLAYKVLDAHASASLSRGMTSAVRDAGQPPIAEPSLPPPLPPKGPRMPSSILGASIFKSFAMSRTWQLSPFRLRKHTVTPGASRESARSTSCFCSTSCSSAHSRVMLPMASLVTEPACRLSARTLSVSLSSSESMASMRPASCATGIPRRAEALRASPAARSISAVASAAKSILQESLSWPKPRT